MIGDEPVWHCGPDGDTVVGWITSGGYAHYSGVSLAWGYIPTELAERHHRLRDRDHRQAVRRADAGRADARPRRAPDAHLKSLARSIRQERLFDPASVEFGRGQGQGVAMRVLHRHVARASMVAALLCLSVVVVAPAAVVHAAPPGASAYVPVSPYRILDTRIGQGFPRRVNAGQAFTLSLPGVPAGASAVVLNLTVDGPAAPGFVTVYPDGGRPTLGLVDQRRPAGLTIANLVTVPIGTGGTVDIYSLMTTDLVADVQGYYMPAVIGASRAVQARSVRSASSIPATRLRSTSARSPRASKSMSTLARLAGLPADATAAALKVTVTESAASGFWTVFPAGTTRPRRATSTSSAPAARSPIR